MEITLSPQHRAIARSDFAVVAIFLLTMPLSKVTDAFGDCVHGRRRSGSDDLLPHCECEEGWIGLRWVELVVDSAASTQN